MITPILGRHFLDGEWLPHAADFASFNPARTGEIVGEFPTASTIFVNQAVAAARVAFPAWRRLSRIHRGECFHRLGLLIERDIDALAALMARECGKILDECRAEVIEGLHMVQYVFGTGRMPIGDVIPSEIAEKDAFVRRKPRGVVGVITPWNFPFAVPLWMLGPSLLEGNTAVFKPSEETPAIGQRLVELFAEAGFPAGTINLVHGAGAVGEAIVQNPDVNAILFTGSSAVGQRIQQISAGFTDRIVAAEMGGKNAVIVCDDADLNIAVPAAVLSAFKTTGQRCVSASRILIHANLYGEFSRRFAASAGRLHFGDPFDTSSFAGPLINRKAVEKTLRYNELAKSEAREMIFAGSEFDPQPGCFVTPCAYAMTHDPISRCLKEEVFGPHVALVPFDDDEQAVQIANATEYGLSLAIITESFRKMRFFREECDYGLGYVNLPCIGAEVHLPFGGVKKSGNGHPSAAGLMETVTQKYAWTVNHGRSIKMAQGMSADVD